MCVGKYCLCLLLIRYTFIYKCFNETEFVINCEPNKCEWFLVLSIVYSKNYLTIDTNFSNDGLGCFIKADYILQKIFSRHCIISRKEIWTELLISQTVTTNWNNDTSKAVIKMPKTTPQRQSLSLLYSGRLYFTKDFQ